MNGCSLLSFRFIILLCVASCQVSTQLYLVFFSPVQILQLATIHQHRLSLYVPVHPSGVRHFARFVPIDLAQQWQGKILNLEHCKHHKKPFTK
jgi:hypothetical protein